MQAYGCLASCVLSACASMRVVFLPPKADILWHSIDSRNGVFFPGPGGRAPFCCVPPLKVCPHAYLPFVAPAPPHGLQQLDPGTSKYQALPPATRAVISAKALTLNPLIFPSLSFSPSSSLPSCLLSISLLPLLFPSLPVSSPSSYFSSLHPLFPLFSGSSLPFSSFLHFLPCSCVFISQLRVSYPLHLSPLSLPPGEFQKHIHIWPPCQGSQVMTSREGQSSEMLSEVQSVIDTPWRNQDRGFPSAIFKQEI